MGCQLDVDVFPNFFDVLVAKPCWRPNSGRENTWCFSDNMLDSSVINCCFFVFNAYFNVFCLFNLVEIERNFSFDLIVRSVEIVIANSSGDCV